MRPVLFRKISIIGMGLLGGSLGLAAKRRGTASHVASYVRRESAIQEVFDAGAADSVSMNLSEAVEDADLIILCTPLGQMKSLAEKIAPQLKSGALVTDVGSVKAQVDSEVNAIFADAGAVFIGSHPMAGSEKTGVSAAREDLFEKATCAICPSASTDKDKVKALVDFWEALGARVLTMTPSEHDQAVSRISHLPHAVASAVASLGLGGDASFEKELAASGFADLTRVASGSPEMWHDISIQNRIQLADATDALIEILKTLSSNLRANESDAIRTFFDEAKQLRDQWLREAAARFGARDKE